jgi:elongation factor 3
MATTILTTAASANPSPIEQELLDMVEVLTVFGKKTPPAPRAEKLEALAGLVAKDDFTKYEPYFVQHLLPIVLARMADKPAVAKAAKTVGDAFFAKAAIQAFPGVAPILFAEMTTEAKWQAKVGALEWLNVYMGRIVEMDRDLLSACLPMLIPAITDVLFDTKQAVADAGDVAINTAMKGVTNRDLEPFVGELIIALKDPEQTMEIIKKLSGVVFVQTVDGGALSVVVPLMGRGLDQPIIGPRRICARIVGNMAKLVEDTLEAAPLLEALIPKFVQVIDTIPDPEAREVATKTHEQLLEIQAKAEASDLAKAARKPEVIAAALMTSLEAKPEQTAVVNYIATMASALIQSKTTEESEWESELAPFLTLLGKGDQWTAIRETSILMIGETEVADELDEGTELCNCEFTLAYGTKILLRNTKLRLLLGMKYGLLGGNDCGKTTLMRAIANGTIDGFPSPDDVRTVFVEADIQGELSHLNCVNYILEWPAIKAGGFSEKAVRDILKSVGFSEGKAAGAGGDCDDPISALSGGWRMKLALARAMLQKADILLMDEPTNHLDTANVKWVISYCKTLTTTTCIMVSHDPQFLDEVCTHMLNFDGLKLTNQKGNLSEYRKTHPEVDCFFEFKASKFSFTFPQPSFLEGVKSRGKVLLKMDDVTFTYPGNTVPTIYNITVKASMASRVACVGRNGAGKSTMVKVLTGQMEPQQGKVWKYGPSKIGYIAQHAFIHIENHVDKSPNEYIRWRYQFGDDREGLDQANMKISDEDAIELKKPVEYKYKNEKGEIKKEKRTIERCTGQRRESPEKKKIQQYEVKWLNKGIDSNTWHTADELIKYHKLYEKMLRIIDAKILARESMLARPLTSANVEAHLNGLGLEPEYATHFRIGALSDGQKVKVVIGAAMWDQPHILILDEPTNYLDRESLGALADAIDTYEGGIIMITHNDAFCSQLCPERWVLEDGRLNMDGDLEWMAKLAEGATEFEQLTEVIDASGNEVKAKAKKTFTAKEKKKKMKEIKALIAKGDELDSDDEALAIDWNL